MVTRPVTTMMDSMEQEQEQAQEQEQEQETEIDVRVTWPTVPTQPIWRMTYG